MSQTQHLCKDSNGRDREDESISTIQYKICRQKLVRITMNCKHKLELAQCHTCYGWFDTVVPYSPDGTKIHVACHQCWKKIRRKLR